MSCEECCARLVWRSCSWIIEERAVHLADSSARGGKFGIRAYLAGVLIIFLAIIGFATSLAARDLSNRSALDDGAVQLADAPVLRVDGSVLWRGTRYTASDLKEVLHGDGQYAKALRLFADRRAPATLAIHLMTSLSSDGARAVALSVF
jgi:hypothetical protein